MDILDLMTRSGTYVLALFVFVMTWLTRRGVQTACPNWRKQADANAPDVTYLTTASRWWNEVILYAVPVAYGSLSSLLPSEFFFSGIDGGAKVMYGAGIGWLSSFFYKALKKLVMGKLGIELPSTNSVV